MTAFLKDVIGYGTHADRPAAGTAGAIYYETDTQTLVRDNGSTWDVLALSTAAAFAGARYYGTVAQPIPTSASTIIDFDTQDYDTGGFVTTGAAWKFTAAAAGYYRVTALITLSSGAWVAGGACELSLFVNGTARSILMRDDSQAASTRQSGAFGSDVVHLAAADYLDVRIFQASGGTLTLQTAGNYDHVAITKVG